MTNLTHCRTCGHEFARGEEYFSRPEGAYCRACDDLHFRLTLQALHDLAKGKDDGVVVEALEKLEGRIREVERLREERDALRHEVKRLRDALGKEKP